MHEWVKIRYYSDEFKYNDLFPKVNRLKGVSNIHIHSADHHCSLRSADGGEIHIITFNYFGTFESIGSLPGQIGIRCDIVSPAKVAFKLSADKEKKQDPKKLKLELPTVAGVRKADVSASEATLWLDLEGLNPQAVEDCARFSGYHATLDSHEFVEVNVKKLEGNYKTLKRNFANTPGVFVVQPEAAERMITVIVLKGKFDDKKVTEIVTGSNFEVSSINRR